MGGRKEGTPNAVTREMGAFFRSVVEDPEYQAAARERMIAGRAPHLEQLAVYYTLGKPAERVTVEQSPSMSKLLLLAAQAATAQRRAREQDAHSSSDGGTLSHGLESTPRTSVDPTT